MPPTHLPAGCREPLNAASESGGQDPASRPLGNYTGHVRHTLPSHTCAFAGPIPMQSTLWQGRTRFSLGAHCSLLLSGCVQGDPA